MGGETQAHIPPNPAVRKNHLNGGDVGKKDSLKKNPRVKSPPRIKRGIKGPPSSKKLTPGKKGGVLKSKKGWVT